MIRLSAVLLSLPLLSAQPAPPRGVWSASVAVEGREVPFRIEFQPAADGIRAAVLDGDRPIWSTSGSFKDGRLELRWDFYDASLAATLEGETLRGVYTRRGRAGIIRRDFSAHPFRPAPAAEPAADFSGKWILETEGRGAAGVMEAIIEQKGGELRGTIQRIDGDFGTLEGRATGNRAILSHFDLIRATLVDLTLEPSGALSGTLDGKTRFRGARPGRLSAAPPDPTTYTRVRDPFTFSFPDADGRIVSSADARFRGKPLIVSITGTWCPNCHDEAELLNELYSKYNAQGLEIVALCFEYTGEPERDRGQIRAFARRHNVRYPMLLAGATDEGDLQKKLPQIENFGAYPTTIFLGRDGKVRAVHAGFAGPANPEEHRKVREEMERLVQELLRK